jgi:SAM-dependent methyltransferase
MASYREALRYSFGRRVLDVGCGTGYGSFFLASYGARHVTAFDFDDVTLSYGQAVYHHPRLRYVRGDGLRLPFEDASFDFVFSSQVIEHVPSPDQFLLEIRRVLATGGFCLITTPNKRLFSPDENHTNPHHISEMDWATYRATAQVFPLTEFRGIPQRCLIDAGIKPDTDLRLEDFCVQNDDLDQCENMLCFGHTQPDGKFSTTLPTELGVVADHLAPSFWDPSVARWSTLGTYPSGNAQTVISLHQHDTLTQIFESPFPGLYRIEIDLADSDSSPVKLRLHSWPDKDYELIQMVQPDHRTLVLQFPSLPHSKGRRFVVTLGHPGGLRNMLKRQKPFRLKSVPKGAPEPSCWIERKPLDTCLSFRTFHLCLPEMQPTDTANEAA